MWWDGSGAFYRIRKGSLYYIDEGRLSTDLAIAFDANRSNAAYGRRDEVAPRNYTTRIWLRTA